VLSAIVAVTLLVPDVDAAARAYQRTLDYQAIEQGQVTEALAGSWGAPALAGRRFVVLQPKSREPVYVRMVETAASASTPMMTLGWNATEILVEDPAALAPRLEAGPFRIVGPPAPLELNPAVVAMQALGPAGELLYFTRIPVGQSKFGLGSATSFVDRVFIVVLGVRDLRGTLDFYRTKFGLAVSEPAPTRVGILADAWGLPPEHSFLLGIVRLPERFLIEVDEYPPGAAARAAAPGELPAGMAMVSFEVPSLEPYLAQLVAPPAAPAGQPYAGRRTAVMIGSAGEHLELIEATPIPVGAPARGGTP
jgi:catechol 2,3-dioxygenase-like lactoylglutathione lyase family enzyme